MGYFSSEIFPDEVEYKCQLVAFRNRFHEMMAGIIEGGQVETLSAILMGLYYFLSSFVFYYDPSTLVASFNGQLQNHCPNCSLIKILKKLFTKNAKFLDY